MTSTPRPAVAQVADSRLAGAFRELHGRRLHGFALLVSLGEAALSERVAEEALEAGMAQADALRHPERAAAWLRARALRGLHQGVGRGAAPTLAERRRALAPLGVDDAMYEGLAGLGLEARAALVASAVERFESIDTETILGTSSSAARKVIARARDRYYGAVHGKPTEQAASPAQLPDGAIATRVREVTERAMTPRWKPPQ
jgi:DNA-directed RNA polymerase specialized sigma24 family protein